MIILRIMMLSHFRYSGVMSHILSLAAALGRQDFEMVVVITGCPPAYLDPLRRYQRHFPCFAESRPGEILRLARNFRIDLLHLHDLAAIRSAERLLRFHTVPCGVTLHDRTPLFANPSLLPPFSFLITPQPRAGDIPSRFCERTFFIPEGIELQELQPLEKEGFRIAVVLEEGSFSSAGSTALLKAAALAALEVDLICPQPLPLLGGRSHGWPLDRSAVFGQTQIVIGQGRCLLEGMACGNAALIMGQNYGGLFKPQEQPVSPLFPDLSAGSGEPPCYRSIFFDLATLQKDRLLLESLQQQGRKFIRENCDLRLIAEQTGSLYRQAAGQ
ncbi:MAG: glycosyltransferase family 4 protein [Firmicutes bacterium]|nr:glycosyltransferase family 4 protein [Bacillota bacterium]